MEYEFRLLSQAFPFCIPEGLQCHISVMRMVAKSCKKANRRRKEKENLTNPILSELADCPRLSSPPTPSDEIKVTAVNRRVASANLARGAKLPLSYRLHFSEARILAD